MRRSEVKGRGWEHGGGKSILDGIRTGEGLWRREDNLVIQQSIITLHWNGDSARAIFVP
jgi:hypothetical protein